MSDGEDSAKRRPEAANDDGAADAAPETDAAAEESPQAQAADDVT